MFSDRLRSRSVSYFRLGTLLWIFLTATTKVFAQETLFWEKSCESDFSDNKICSLSAQHPEHGGSPDETEQTMMIIIKGDRVTIASWGYGLRSDLKELHLTFKLDDQSQSISQEGGENRCFINTGRGISCVLQLQNLQKNLERLVKRGAKAGSLSFIALTTGRPWQDSFVFDMQSLRQAVE